MSFIFIPKKTKRIVINSERKCTDNPVSRRPKSKGKSPGNEVDNNPAVKTFPFSQQWRIQSMLFQSSLCHNVCPIPATHTILISILRANGHPILATGINKSFYSYNSAIITIKKSIILDKHYEMIGAKSICNATNFQLNFCL